MNEDVSKLPKMQNGEEFKDLTEAMDALKAWHEHYNFSGKPETEDQAMNLAKSVKGSLFSRYAGNKKLTGNALLHAIFLAVAGELLGPGADRTEYRALKDSFSKMLSLREEIGDYTH